MAVGVGSAVFHGPMPSWGRYVHDLPLVVVALVAAAPSGAAANLWRPRTGVWIVVSSTVGVAVLLAALPDAAVPLTVLSAAGAGVCEAAAHRRQAARERRRLRGIYLLIALLVIPAAALNGLGRTGGPFCTPTSALQAHALWHVATALALGVYGWGILSRREEVAVGREGRAS